MKKKPIFGISLCDHPPSARKRKEVNGLLIVDCTLCGQPLQVDDRYKRVKRPSIFMKFLRLWRALKPGEYIVASLARAIRSDPDTVLNFITWYARCDLDGKPVPREIIIPIVVSKDSSTGSPVLEYRVHRGVIKDPDPEEGEPWPYDVYFVSIERINKPKNVIAGEDFEIDVHLDYCFTSPAEVFFGLLDIDGNWLAYTTDVLTGEGSKTITLVVKAPLRLGDFHLEIQAHVFEEGNWRQADSIPLDLAVSEFRCLTCRNIIANDGLFDGQVFSCPHSCGQFYKFAEGKVEPLVRIDLRETWGLLENFLLLTLANMQNRTLRFFVELSEDNTSVNYGSVELEPMQSREIKLLPPSGKWRRDSRLQAVLRDQDGGMGYSTNEVVWWDPPVRGIIVGGGIGGIATRGDPLGILFGAGIGAATELFLRG